MTVEKSPITTDVDFSRDGRQQSYLRVPHSRNDSAWGTLLIPITVIKNGRGPTVLFTAGLHGGEFEGPVCLMKLSQSLAPEQVQGRVILLPSLNLPAVQIGERLSPIDGKDLNRVFPGKWSGTTTEVIAHYVHEAILPLCDAVVDLHSGGVSLSLVPYISMHYLDDEKQNVRTRAALEAFQAPAAVVIHEISGEGLLDYAVEGMGKVFLCAELGSAGTLSSRALAIAETGVHNLLVHFGLVEGDVVTRDQLGQPPTRFLEVPGPDCYHHALTPGIYESFLELGDEAVAGQALGQIHAVGNPNLAPDLITAQRSGLLLVTHGPGLAGVGDCVAVLAQDATLE